jgi:hypothetical protein
MNFDEAAEKASRYMLDYLESEHQLSRADAYMLCSLACDLKIAQVVNEPHRFVAMHVRKDIFAAPPPPLLGATGGNEAILEGRQPARLTRKWLLEIELPLDWSTQERLLGLNG